jgi:predicted  nucleic acid-binding Zn-ribbon protein
LSNAIYHTTFNSEEEIEHLQKEILKLSIHINSLNNRVEVLEREQSGYSGRNQEPVPPRQATRWRRSLSPAERKIGPSVKDRNGITVRIGDRSRFLTKEKYDSKEGIVYKITTKGDRITAYDKDQNFISRALRNVANISILRRTENDY